MVLCFLSFGIMPNLLSQDTLKHIVVPGKIIEGDTVPYIDLRTVVVFPQLDFKSWSELVGYERLVINIKKVYPYAKLAAVKLTAYKHKLDSIPTERERKKFLKAAEKDLEAQFGNEIKELNFTQGKLLIKLIYRQTGNSTFAIVKELRGSFNAFIYQTVARIFGYDLRSQYDPEGSDKAIEHIVQMIEDGSLE
ncbi:MAG TPA: DUF4294 domain-containing protein [Bacteroidales bacterium]|nr:DUF4294 domain-containing protein [Bacteroidales bacterium]